MHSNKIENKELKDFQEAVLRNPHQYHSGYVKDIAESTTQEQLEKIYKEMSEKRLHRIEDKK